MIEEDLGVIVSKCNCIYVLRAKPIVSIKKKKKRKQRNGISSLVLADDDYAAT